MNLLERIGDRRRQAVLSRLMAGDTLQMQGGQTANLQQKVAYRFPDMELEGWRAIDGNGLPLLVSYSTRPGHRKIAVSRPVSRAQLQTWKVEPRQLVNGVAQIRLQQASGATVYRRALTDVPARRTLGTQETRFFYQLWAEEDGDTTLEVELDDARRHLLCYSTRYTQLEQLRIVPDVLGAPARIRHEDQQIDLHEIVVPPVAETTAVAIQPRQEVALPVRTSAMELANQVSLPPQTVGKLLQEAERADMTLQQLMRKVLDLPPEQGPDLMVPLPLSQSERALLAKRHNIDPSDWNMLQTKLAEELKLFLGK